MALRNVILFLLVSAVVCKPRDSTAVHANNEIVQNTHSLISGKTDTSTQTENKVPASYIHNRVPCDHEEATEDVVCQEHCVPKGYSYGLCVSKTCSCA